ncbi:amino acid ABC transporter substrate-binding protein [Roseomonas sp. BN140053]|uniref:amino acid ABC transporter substrate-binding protein n=1 Tax=Roseomonas sp. BN140053 TaxID=3391898 RepID=UPI0039EC0F83
MPRFPWTSRLRAAALALPLAVTAGLAAAQAPAPAPASRSATPVLDAVKARGHLRCGVSQGVAGFSLPDSQGRWNGFDVDFCRAVAAAVFGDADAVRYSPYSAQQRFTALQSGEVDLLSRITTVTFQRDVQLGLEYAGVAHYDGAGFLARKAPGLTEARGLDGGTVCVQAGSTNEVVVADFARANSITLRPLVFQTLEELTQAFFAGRCDAFNWDRSALAGLRLRAPNPDDYVLLSDVVSKEPYGPVVAQGDVRWLEIVRWTLAALIEAEEQGLTSANVEAALNSASPNTQRLLGVSGGFGTMLGIPDRWAFQAIRQVGNFGEMFERNLTPIGIDRGLNRLWNKGGLMYAPPIR